MSMPPPSARIMDIVLLCCTILGTRWFTREHDRQSDFWNFRHYTWRPHVLHFSRFFLRSRSGDANFRFSNENSRFLLYLRIILSRRLFWTFQNQKLAVFGCIWKHRRSERNHYQQGTHSAREWTCSPCTVQAHSCTFDTTCYSSPRRYNIRNIIILITNNSHYTTCIMIII